MARKETLKVQEGPPVRAGQMYPAVLCHIEKKPRPTRVVVRLRNLHPKHEGRVHEVTLPLPLHTYGVAADFFRAVGQNVEAGDDIVLRDTVGKNLRIKFGPTSDGSVAIVSFEPPAEEKTNAAEHE